MSKSFMTFDFLHSFEIFSHFGIHSIGTQLSSISVLEISLSVQKPHWNSTSNWVIHNVLNNLALFFIQLSGSQIWVNSCDLANQMCEPSSNTFDNSEPETDFPLSINIGVENTKNMFEILTVFHY